MKLLYIPLLLLFLSSCKENPYVKEIVGDWKLVSDEHSPDLAQTVFNDWSQTFSFYSNNSIIVGNGYRVFRKKFRFVGTKTVYKIKRDSLFVLSLSDSIWQKRKIKRITKDSLILQNEANRFERYVRIHYASGNKQFDKIILATSGCFGTCPIQSVLLERGGNFYFNGLRYTEKDGFFRAKVPAYLLDRLMKNFDNMDIQKLEEERLPVIDGECLSFVFLKNDTIVKSVKCRGSLGTPEFETAVVQLRFLHQQLRLDSIAKASVPFSCRHLKFEKNGKYLDLSSSLCFLFWTEFLKGKLTTGKVKPRFELYVSGLRGTDYSLYEEASIDPDLKEIVTDGRFYQLIFKIKPSYTMDLGYNFFDRYLKVSEFRRGCLPPR